ncbi:MAG: hypothetical protein KGI41_00335 [Patescibacteria group bacterium]|nr:hypothetical protein [Patescibacteria group bacterium]MDE1965678.1 hypothetical protein [Patescibacteria group bacterium]
MNHPGHDHHTLGKAGHEHGGHGSAGMYLRRFWTVTALLIAGLLGWAAFAPSGNPALVTTHGLHWHAMLTIEVGTTTIPVPAGIGLGASEMPIHTHDDTGRIHMEFPGVVHESDLELHRVFDEWGHPMDSFGSNMIMTINSATSTAYGSYVMRDGDTIVLRYE